jgi:hypothetical protein
MNWKIKVFTLKSIQGMISVSNRQLQKITELSLYIVRRCRRAEHHEQRGAQILCTLMNL